MAVRVLERSGRGSITTASTKAADRSYQAFPEAGSLSGNMNLDHGGLVQRIGVNEDIVYCYIVTTVEYKGGRLLQSGSAPNFQGGLITLCTCKWMMRAGRPVDEWIGCWIAGITGAETGRDTRGHLFFLMRVGQAFASHRDLWTWLSAKAPEAGDAKAADKSRLGDVYLPHDFCEHPFVPGDYISPCSDHIHSGEEWRQDIDYHAYGRRPALLVGDPKESFLWSEPRIQVPFLVGRGSKRATLSELLGPM